MECPVCHKGETQLEEGFHRCPMCGADQRINQVSGHVIWLKAERDVQEQQAKSVERHEKEKAKYDNGDD